MPLSALKLIEARRSIRRFSDDPVSAEDVLELVEAACLAPAPHHSRPWRFAVVVDSRRKVSLAAAMADRWRIDLEGDGVSPERIDQLTAASIDRLTSAPSLVVACLTAEGLDTYSDDRRAGAELAMARLSLGAALENLLLVAADAGLGACWIASPIFCPVETRTALDLPPEWSPQAAVLIGHPDRDYEPPARTAVRVSDFSLIR